MIGVFSRVTGILLLPKRGEEKYSVFDVSRVEECSTSEFRYSFSSAQDWEDIKGADSDEILKLSTNEYWLSRLVSYFQIVLQGIDKSLELEVFEYIEDNIGLRNVDIDKVLNRLLIAPLANSNSASKTAESAFSNGFSVTGSLLDNLISLQPLLHRLSDLWLGIDDVYFSSLVESKEDIWLMIVEKCNIKELLISQNILEFNNSWNLLMYHLDLPRSRVCIGRIGKVLSRGLNLEKNQDSVENLKVHKKKIKARSYKKANDPYLVVTKQIEAIIGAVSKGHDRKAEQYLNDLVNSQISDKNNDYAVKSLCNIAQRCADMFRLDFEFKCLSFACKISPYDSWALIQYGDHQKRKGNYKDALRFFREAISLSDKNSVIAESALADVFASKGKYEAAVSLYKRIPVYTEKIPVLTAIADIYRKMGEIEKAKNSYNKLLDLIRSHVSNDGEERVLAGLAEIYKINGEFDKSEKLYERILEVSSVSAKDNLYYKLGLCNVLTLQDKFNKALNIIDSIIQEFPFFMRARCHQSSLLALLGEEQDALDKLSNIKVPDSVQEWRHSYYKGLLLMKLSRYDEARKLLVDKLAHAIQSDENKAQLRIGAVLSYLESGENCQANKILEKISDNNDLNLRYLSLVLQFHSATQEEDEKRMTTLRAKLRNIQIVDSRLGQSVVAIEKRKFKEALVFETEYLMKYVA